MDLVRVFLVSKGECLAISVSKQGMPHSCWSSCFFEVLCLLELSLLLSLSVRAQNSKHIRGTTSLQYTLSGFPLTYSLLPFQRRLDIATGCPGTFTTMPAKATLTELNEGQIKFLFSVLKNCDEVKPDWNAVAAENGIGYARNA